MTPSFPNDRNIVLTGFMGTGKTTIGRLLAERLGRDFFDMDDAIVSHFGKSIPEIFAEDGETVFRVFEGNLCRQFSQLTGIVVSTGGGTLVNPGNRKVLANSGLLICLTATVDEILARLDDTDDRPLLRGTQEERRQRIWALLGERRHAYAAIQHQVDTTGLSPHQIVDRLMQTLGNEMEAPGMLRIPVIEPGGEYDICIGDGLLADTGRLLANRDLRQGSAALVSNSSIADVYAETVLTSLREAGYSPTLCLVPEGEAHKTLDSVGILYEQFLDAGLDRRSPIISLGGGVIGDMTGFAAATYLRGVPFVQIPTSLLAMVDASVGGKTGVDLPQGKNLVGAFKQPAVVLIDPAVLQSLPPAEFRSGLAEVVKHGIIAAPDLFHQLEDQGPTTMAHLVADAVRVKVNVVQEDPFEQGRRAVLNLGHTFGHAIELVSDFQIRHGEGVALGMVAATHLSVQLEQCEASLLDRVVHLLDRLDLPTSTTGLEVSAVHAAMSHDKKRSGKTLRFIIPLDLGDVTIIDDPGSETVRRSLEYILR